MNPRVQIVAIVGSVLMFLIVLQLIRRRKLREEYALLWLIAATVLLGFSIWRDAIHELARLVGVAYAPSVLLLGSIIVGFLVAMHFSVSLSRLAEENKKLAQELALLREQMDESVAPKEIPADASPAVEEICRTTR